LDESTRPVASEEAEAYHAARSDALRVVLTEPPDERAS